jgi:peroxiredoxin
VFPDAALRSMSMLPSTNRAICTTRASIRRFRLISAALRYAAILSISARSQSVRNVQASRWVSK